MARSPESAKAKDAAAKEIVSPAKREVAHGRRLKGPDGFVYTWHDVLAARPGFVEFEGETDARGFAKPTEAAKTVKPVKPAAE